jgi:DNA-binding response OmpR family regulator
MATKSAPLILSVSRDGRLLRLRQMVLESAGWRVVTMTDCEGAITSLKDQNFDAVVLGHSIPPAERISLAQRMKAIRSNVPIVMVCVHGDNTFSTKIADARVGSLDGPIVLINAIRRVTGEIEKEM